MKMAVYAPLSYILPSRLRKYEEMYDTEVEGRGRLRQADREKSLQTLMTVNLLKRLESSVEAFRLTLRRQSFKLNATLSKIEAFQSSGRDASVEDVSRAFENSEPDDDDFSDLDESQIEGKVQINLADMDLPSWEYDLRADLTVIEYLLTEMEKVTPDQDAKLQHLKSQIANKLAYPFNPGNKKVLLFTAFADTANYLYEHISGDLLRSQGLHTGKVTGSDSPKSTIKKTYDFQSLFVSERTTALIGTIAGLEDFELINFLVIQGRE